MSTFDSLITELTNDYDRAQPSDVLLFCLQFFQKRMEEQRHRTRDFLIQGARTYARSLPPHLYVDTPSGPARGPTPVSPFTNAPTPRSSLRNSISPSPFGTLNVPGNALLSDPVPPVFNFNGNDIPPTSPRDTSSNPGPFPGLENGYVRGARPDRDSLGIPNYNLNIFERRTSVSAESIAVDDVSNEPLPVYPKTPEQLRRIEASIAKDFLFRNLDEEQIRGALDAMQEKRAQKGEIIIRQGDSGDYFYVVESGHLNCYVRTEPLFPPWFKENHPSTILPPEQLLPGNHPTFGVKVTECRQGNSFGELALMHNHPRRATVVAMEPSTLWFVDRVTFRTIILSAAHKRKVMYEDFLATVGILSPLSAGDRSKIADALKTQTFRDGEAVVREGEPGHTFFFVEEGEATVTKRQPGENGEMREIKVGHYKKGDYFGELSLLRLAPRAATVSAIYRTDPSLPKLKVAALEADAFTRLMGPLRDLMERNAERYGPAPRMSISR